MRFSEQAPAKIESMSWPEFLVVEVPFLAILVGGAREAAMSVGAGVVVAFALKGGRLVSELDGVGFQRSLEVVCAFAETTERSWDDRRGAGSSARVLCRGKFTYCRSRGSTDGRLIDVDIRNLFTWQRSLLQGQCRWRCVRFRASCAPFHIFRSRLVV